MNNHDIVVIGASAGGVEALTKLVRTLPSQRADLFHARIARYGAESICLFVVSQWLPVPSAISEEVLGHVIE
jgi:hypothetical protein